MAKTRGTQKSNRSIRYKGIKRKLLLYSEDNLRNALNEIRNNNMKIRAASRFFSVPKTTLIDRLSGRVPEILRHPGPQPLLGKIARFWSRNQPSRSVFRLGLVFILFLGVEGETIRDWVINIAKCGFPITKDMLLETVAKVDKDSRLNLFKGKKPGQQHHPHSDDLKFYYY